MRFSARSRVDLPQPDGPIRAVTALSANGIETSCSDLWSP